MAGEAALTDWGILWRLGPLVLLAVFVGVPAQIRTLATVRETDPPDWSAYAGPTVIMAVIGLLAAVVGTVAAARVGLEAPALSPPAGGPGLQILVRHLGWGVVGGLLVAIVVIPFYYGIMRSLFEPDGLATSEAVRRGMGLSARIAIGGVLEEVVFRWAALALLAWAGLGLTGGIGSAVQWAAILGAALLFGLAHLPGAEAIGVRVSSALLLAGLAMNGWLGIVAGWIVWHRGLVAAMAVHATVHILWFAVERIWRA